VNQSNLYTVHIEAGSFYAKSWAPERMGTGALAPSGNVVKCFVHCKTHSIRIVIYALFSQPVVGFWGHPWTALGDFRLQTSNLPAPRINHAGAHVWGYTVLIANWWSVGYTRTELGRRSFPIAASTVWNSLPAHLRSTLIGRRQFRDGLKSYLFADAYFW